MRTKLNDIAKWYVDYKPGDETNNKKQMYDFNIIFPNLVGHGLDAANRSDYDCRVANFVITRGSQGIGIRCITAHPAIERSIALEHDVSKADKVSLIGHFCYEKHFCIDLESELAAAKDDVGKKFAAIASVMNNWKPEKEKDKGQGTEHSSTRTGSVSSTQLRNTTVSPGQTQANAKPYIRCR